MTEAVCNLPDDVLLLVFEHLNVPDLLSVRGVCRRCVAETRAAWRHRDLTQSTEPIGAVLRVAPCLRRLELDRASIVEVPLQGVRCAVSTVYIQCAQTFMMCPSSKGYSPWAKRVRSWNTHDTLGVLNTLLHEGVLSLTLCNYAADSLSLRLLLRVIRCSGLRELCLKFRGHCSPGGVGGGGPLALRGQNEAFLQRVGYSYFRCPPSGPGRAHWPPSLHALAFLLQTHASTLTSVSLIDVPCDFPADLLTACVNLRELKCEALDNMPALLQCSGLENLHLVLTQRGHLDRPAVLQGVRDFFSEAVGLRRLALSFAEDYDDVAREVQLDLLRALAATRRSQLTSLSPSNSLFRTVIGGARFHVRIRLNYVSLSALLPMFSKLTRIVLSEVGHARECWPELVRFLRTITPSTTPLLRLLELPGVGVCPDHRDEKDTSGRHVVQEIPALMSRNPALHFAGLVVCVECQEDGCLRRLECDRCWVEGGVAEPSFYWTKARFGFFSHDPKEPCDLHTGCKEWVKVAG